MFSLVLCGASGFCTKLFKWCSLISAHLFIKLDLALKANSGHCGVWVFCLNEWKKHRMGRTCTLVSVRLTLKSHRMPPEEGLLQPHQPHLFLKGGIKQRQRGKVIFSSQLSFFLLGFFHFLLCTVIKLIIISQEPLEWERMRSLYPPLSSPLLFLGRRKSY